MASVSCASAEIEPKLIAPVQNRLTISLAGITSSSGIGPPLAPGLNVEQAAQRAARLRIAIRMIGEAAIGIDAVVAGGDLQIGDRRRVPHVPFAVGPPVELARIGQHGQPVDRLLRIAERMPPQRFFGQHVEIDALNAAGRAGEAAVDHFVLEADGFEDLRTLVALQRRDAHLGHHLEHALGDALAIRVDQIVVFLVTGSYSSPLAPASIAGCSLPSPLWSDRSDPSGRCSRPSRRECHSDFERQIRVDRVGAVADQQAMMMHFAGFARFDDDADPRALRLAHQMMMHGAGRQQRAERHAIAADRAIGQHDERDSHRRSPLRPRRRCGRAPSSCRRGLRCAAR